MPPVRSSASRNANLRRAQIGFFGAWTAEWAFTVGLGIVAYRDGGATAVGLVGLLRMAPSAIFAPLLSPLADRGRRDRVLILVSVLRGVVTGAVAVIVGVGGPVWIVYALAVVSTVFATLYRPAHSERLPSLCHTGYARQRQRGPWAAGFRRHLGRSAAGCGAAPGHRCHRRVRCGCGRLVVGCSLVVAAQVRAPPRSSPRARPTWWARRSKAFESSVGTPTSPSLWASPWRRHSPVGR